MVFHHRLGPELTAAELHAVLALRVAVFVVEQACPYPEVDGRDLDPTTGHRWLADPTGIACYLRTLDGPDPTSPDPINADRINAGQAGPVRIGRVVTRADRRGQGLAAQLLADTLGATDAAGRPTVLAAQTRLQPWYEGFGYAVTGPEFLDDGIPHVPMGRPVPTGHSRSTNGADEQAHQRDHHEPARPAEGARC